MCVCFSPASSLALSPFPTLSIAEKKCFQLRYEQLMMNEDHSGKSALQLNNSSAVSMAFFNSPRHLNITPYHCFIQMKQNDKHRSAEECERARECKRLHWSVVLS